MHETCNLLCKDLRHYQKYLLVYRFNTDHAIHRDHAIFWDIDGIHADGHERHSPTSKYFLRKTYPLP